MSVPSLLALYNQNFQDDPSFLAGFVARRDLAEFLLQQLKLASDDAPVPAHLIVGQRGMGKTSLLRRIAIGIMADPDLRRRYIPLRFREEQYNVLTLAALWRNCAESLAEWCEDHAPDSPFPALFDRESETPAWRDAETVREAFAGEAARLRARPLLLIDNLDLILDALGPEENWALRRALQAPRGPALIAAATHMPAQLGDRDAAFYEFFRPQILRPLSADELIVCLRSLAIARGEEGRPVLRVLDVEPRRLRALHAFTGGNPRVLALIYRLIESEGTHEALADLEALLDQLTPYYKGRVEEYATPQQRSVIDALALNWDPISAHDLADATGIVVTTISSQLARLRADGLIEEVELAGARAGYQMVERLFNIWYLMRHGTRRTQARVKWLTKFLVMFYPEEDLRGRWATTAAMNGSRERSLSDYRAALAGAIEEIERRAPQDGAHDIRAPLKNLNDGTATSEANVVRDLFARGRFAEALEACERILARVAKADPPAQPEEVAWTLLAKGVTLGALGRSDEAVAVYDEVVARFGDASELGLREQVARALFNKGVRLGALGRSEEAVAVYDEVAARFGDASELGLREQVARALVNKGFTLGALGRSDEAVAVYDEVAARFGDASELGQREQVARALFNKGVRLGALGRSEEAVAVYDEVAARFGDASELGLREQVARALVNKGFTLGALGRSEEAVAVYDEVAARFGDARELGLREQVAGALVNKGFTLGALARSEEAVAVCDEVAARFGDASELGLREQVAGALVNKGVTLAVLGRSEEAVAVYDEVAARFGEASEEALRVPVALSLLLKAGILAATPMGLSDAETAYRWAISLGAPTSAAAKLPLAWLYLRRGAREEAAEVRRGVDEAPEAALALLDAGLELAADNFGAAVAHFDRAAQSLDKLLAQSDVVVEFLRLAYMRGFGEKLITHFVEARHAESLAPYYAALVALVRGERHLRDVNPEIRAPATTIYHRLVAPLPEPETAPTRKSGTKRGRPAKRRGR